MSKTVLEFLARIGLLDKENTKEHKYLWIRVMDEYGSQLDIQKVIIQR
jgi:hypothetical protein